MELVAVDIGGTHARFAIATVGDDGAIELSQEMTQKTSDHASLKTAWEAFEAAQGKPLPPRAAIAIAGPVTGETVRMTPEERTSRMSRYRTLAAKSCKSSPATTR